MGIFNLFSGISFHYQTQEEAFESQMKQYAYIQQMKQQQYSQYHHNNLKEQSRDESKIIDVVAVKVEEIKLIEE